MVKPQNLSPKKLHEGPLSAPLPRQPDLEPAAVSTHTTLCFLVTRSPTRLHPGHQPCPPAPPAALAPPPLPTPPRCPRPPPPRCLVHRSPSPALPVRWRPALGVRGGGGVAGQQQTQQLRCGGDGRSEGGGGRPNMCVGGGWVTYAKGGGVNCGMWGPGSKKGKHGVHVCERVCVCVRACVRA